MLSMWQRSYLRHWRTKRRWRITISENISKHNVAQMYINHKNLECKIDLEDILIRAGFTLDRENILQGLLKEGLTASDLIDGSLSEEELRYFVPKLGPRKRLCKLLRSEKRDLVGK